MLVSIKLLRLKILANILKQIFFQGTGKSFLSEVICDTLRSMHSDNSSDGFIVAVLAPTGLAAFNIKGLTIHRILKLPVQRNKNQPYFELQEDHLKELRKVTEHLDLIIIGDFFNKFKF